MPVSKIDRSEILNWLRENDETRLAVLWRWADRVRRENVGDDVHLRGLIEISNYCARHCAYCGISLHSRELARYRMAAEEILDCVRQAVDFGYGTVVLQSGEDYGCSTEWIAALVRRIKNETPLAVTLSLGERPEEDLMAWRDAGADRYLLRFETSNRRLYESIHPPLAGRVSDRIFILKRIKQLGYEVGSGVMIGIPGQTYSDLARDIETFKELDLDMIGIGPFIPHPNTPLAVDTGMVSDQQVPATELMAYKVLALTRIMCPRANIPSTTALATLNKVEGRELGLARGANIVMPNLTPPAYRILYEIYPDKACIYEDREDCDTGLRGRITALGRRIGAGRGDSLNRAK